MLFGIGPCSQHVAKVFFRCVMWQVLESMYKHSPCPNIWEGFDSEWIKPSEAERGGWVFSPIEGYIDELTELSLPIVNSKLLFFKAYVNKGIRISINH